MSNNEGTALLRSGGTNEEDHGAIATGSRASRTSRFGSNQPSKGVRPKRETIGMSSNVLTRMDSIPRKRTVTFSAKKKKKGQRRTGGAQSFITRADGSVATMTPVEMGRTELYNRLPFTAVPGMQKKERATALSFSTFAAALDVEETDEFMSATTGLSMEPKEKEDRMSRLSMMLFDELEDPEKGGYGLTLPLAVAVGIACLLTFMIGYNTGVMNPSEVYAFPGHSTAMWSYAVSAFCVGGPFGAKLAGKWADEKGRAGAILVTAWIYLLGGIVQSLAPTLGVVVIARVIIGIAGGASSVLVPVYIGELAPPNLRGFLGTFIQFAYVIGILFADILGFVLANESDWRYMFIFNVLLGGSILLLRPFLYESPRWLLEQDRNSTRARLAIKKIRGFNNDEEVEDEVDLYVGASQAQSLESDNDSSTKEKHDATAELFADKKVRFLLVSSLLLQVSGQLSGVNAVFYYSSLFFEGIIDDPLVGTTLMALINVIATYFALFVMDKYGRRTLIMFSSAGMFVSCVLIVMSLSGYLNNIMALVAVASYVTFYELGLGPLPSLIVAEMFDGKYVAAAMSACSQVLWVGTFLVGFFFPYMNEALGPYSFGPFAVGLLLTFIYAWIWLPETRGTTPAELQAKLVERNELVTYHNIDIEGTVQANEPGFP